MDTQSPSRSLFVACPGEEASQMRGDTLVLPAVSMANVGQLACDLLLNQVYVSCKETLKADRIGCLRTRHVLPVAGCHALDSADPAQVCTNVEVFRVHDKQVTVVQQRAPVLAGHVSAYVKELCAWINDVGFSRVIMLGGADASGRTDTQIMNREPRFVTTSAVDVAQLEELASQSVRPLEEDPSNTASNGPQLLNAGLLNLMHRTCEDSGVAFIGLVLFCKEGVNISEGLAMAACANNLIQLITLPTASTEKSIRWKPPTSWSVLMGGVPDTKLYM